MHFHTIQWKESVICYHICELYEITNTAEEKYDNILQNAGPWIALSSFCK